MTVYTRASCAPNMSRTCDQCGSELFFTSAIAHPILASGCSLVASTTPCARLILSDASSHLNLLKSFPGRSLAVAPRSLKLLLPSA